MWNEHAALRIVGGCVIPVPLLVAGIAYAALRPMNHVLNSVSPTPVAQIAPRTESEPTAALAHALDVIVASDVVITAPKPLSASQPALTKSSKTFQCGSWEGSSLASRFKRCEWR